MITVLPLSHRDLPQVEDLLSWMQELGGCMKHQALLVASSQVPLNELQRLLTKASGIFNKVVGVKQREVNEEPWPRASNALFRTAAEGVKGHYPGQAWLWVESDAIPMAKGWLDAIDAEYRKLGKPFMGCMYQLPWPHLNGVMVYPPTIQKFNGAMLQTEPAKLPWDCREAPTTLKYGAITKLIWRGLKNPERNEPHTFPTIESLRVIPEGVLLAHCSKDGTLIARLRERGAIDAPTPKPQATHARIKTVVNSVARRVTNAVTGRQVYYHSGNLGDIIYGLYAIKLAGGGDLIVGPEQKGTAACSNPVNKAQFDLLKPLLEKQTYLRKVEWRPQHPGNEATIDMNRFRDLWYDQGVRVKTGINTLCQMHCELLGVSDRFREDEPWLEIDAPVWTDLIIVNRTERHLSGNGHEEFPWPELVNKYRDKMLFVGLQKECEKFRKDFGQRVAFYECRDFLDMARVIHGGCAAVMNQSFPCAMAIALGQKVFQEVWRQSPDCVFNRAGLLNL